jgi:hypothetical protein
MPDPREEAVAAADAVDLLRQEERFAIGDKHAGGTIDVVYTHDCPNGHEIRGAMGVIPCPYCAVKDADALRARLAEAEAKHAERINAYGRDGDDARRREGEAVARAETAEAACETSGAALVVMNDLLKEAEADRDTAQTKANFYAQQSVTLRDERDALTEALQVERTHGGVYDELAQVAAIVGSGHFDHREVGRRLDRMREEFYGRTTAALAAVKGREDA